MAFPKLDLNPIENAWMLESWVNARNQPIEMNSTNSAKRRGQISNHNYAKSLLIAGSSNHVLVGACKFVHPILVFLK